MTMLSYSFNGFWITMRLQRGWVCLAPHSTATTYATARSRSLIRSTPRRSVNSSAPSSWACAHAALEPGIFICSLLRSLTDLSALMRATHQLANDVFWLQRELQVSLLRDPCEARLATEPAAGGHAVHGTAAAACASETEVHDFFLIDFSWCAFSINSSLNVLIDDTPLFFFFWETLHVIRPEMAYKMKNLWKTDLPNLISLAV